MIFRRHQEIHPSLYLIMLLQFGVGGALVPFVTLLLRDRGLEISQIGQVLTASSSTLLIFPFLWGMLADRFIPLNRLFVFLNLVAALSLGLLVFQQSFWGILLVFTCFYACFHPTLTLINALSFHHLKNPREQFGTLRAWGSAGWIVPSLPISVILALGWTQRLDFALYLTLGLALAAASVGLLLPHTAPGGAGRNPSVSRSIGYWVAMKRLVSNPDYLVILLSFFLMSGSFTILVFYSPPYLEDAGVNRAWIGPIQCLGVVLEIFLFRWLPFLIRRWNYTAIILAGCCALFGRHLIYFGSQAAEILAASYLLAGMVIVFFNITCSILVNAIAEREVRATAQTLIMLFGSGLGPLFANGAASWIAGEAHEDLRPVFLFAAGLAGLAAILVAIRGAHLNRAAHTAEVAAQPVHEPAE